MKDLSSVALSSENKTALVLVRSKTEMRGAATVQKSVVFLYPSRESAENSREEGASGFILGIESKVIPNKTYYYAITNRHVVESGCSVIRINARGGGADYFDLKPTDWITSASDDLAGVGK